jgi:hypothetical protein
VSLLSLPFSILSPWLINVPNQRDGFNFWMSLQTFDQIANGGVVTHLNCEAQFKLILGFLLIFLVSIIVELALELFNMA